MDLLQKEYYGKNIQFLTIAIDDAENRKKWETFWAENPYAGIHTFADATNKFNQDYMIISVPRFILIGPDGKIINSNAPRPSGQIRQVLETLEI